MVRLRDRAPFSTNDTFNAILNVLTIMMEFLWLKSLQI